MAAMTVSPARANPVVRALIATRRPRLRGFGGKGEGQVFAGIGAAAHGHDESACH